jgi:hypothetical protein
MKRRDVATFERSRRNTYTPPSLPSSPWKDPLLPTPSVYSAKLTYTNHRNAAKALSSPTIICFILYISTAEVGRPVPQLVTSLNGDENKLLF